MQAYINSLLSTNPDFRKVDPQNYKLTREALKANPFIWQKLTATDPTQAEQRDNTTPIPSPETTAESRSTNGASHK